MTSEIENFLRDDITVERKVEADKAIAVSSANLIAGPNGEVPLSKQSAMSLPTPQVPVEQNAGTDVTEEFDLTPAPGMTTTPTSAVVSDTITEAPVTTESPDKLGALDIGSIIPDIPLVTDKVEETKPQEEEKPTEVTLPENTEKVLAEEPTTINNNLFVGGPSLLTPDANMVETELKQEEPNTLDSLDLGVNAPATETVTETVEEPVNTEVPVTSESPAEETVTETETETLEPQTFTPAPEPVAEEVKDTEVAPAPVEEAAAPTDLNALDPKEEIPTFNAAPEVTTEELNAPVTEEVKEEVKENISDSKLDLIYNKLCDLENVTKAILEASRKEVELEEEAKIQELPQTPDIPTLPETPLEPTTSEEEKNDVVDALDQIPEPKVDEIDESPIMGMFV